MSKENAAVCYSQTSTIQKQDGMELLANDQLSLGTDSQVLDLGCGTGYLANVIAERVGPEGKVVAVDPDGERIKMAKECYGNTDRKHLIFLVANDKDFPEGEYDIVFSSDVIHWIEDKDALFKRVYKNLKPGGRFGFTTFDNPTHSKTLIQILQLFGPQTVKATVGAMYWKSAEEYEQFSRLNGFEEAYIEIKEQSYTLPNIDSFIDFFYGVFQGKFDRSSVALNDLKKQYEGQTFVHNMPRLTIILKKPLSSI